MPAAKVEVLLLALVTAAMDGSNFPSSQCQVVVVVVVARSGIAVED
jgi:hypothetical protein